MKYTKKTKKTLLKNKKKIGGTKLAGALNKGTFREGSSVYRDLNPKELMEVGPLKQMFNSLLKNGFNNAEAYSTVKGSQLYKNLMMIGEV
tara:strand:+ start:816 stop:1085 length:270 start_codon:yes stop_codon:yes gene_type:complete